MIKELLQGADAGEQQWSFSCFPNAVLQMAGKKRKLYFMVNCPGVMD